jgi:F0F1-type ATP synthase membrane subunit b/b'
MTFDVHFWEGICFFTFIALAYKPIKGALTKSLDDYAKAIKQKVTDADNLRAEAEKLCHYYAGQHKAFEAKFSAMTRHLEENITLLKKNAAKKLEEQIKIKQQIHKDKLELLTREKAVKMKEAIVQKAMTIAEFYMADAVTPNVKKSDINNLLNTIKNKSITFH